MSTVAAACQARKSGYVVGGRDESPEVAAACPARKSGDVVGGRDESPEAAAACPARKSSYVVGGRDESPEAGKKTDSGERPLVRATSISTPTIHLYRLMILVRIGIFVFFFKWRITSSGSISASNGDGGAGKAGATWTAVCIAGELWFALMWVLDQLPKMRPVRRTADVAALDEARLTAMDVFVTTADPEKEPPMVTASTVLSVLAADYPPEKLTCYVSDDGGGPLIREVLEEVSLFGKLWVPFCRKHGVEPRSPEAYFGTAAAAAGGMGRGSSYKGKAWPEMARDRRRVRREYEELRRRVDALHADDIRRRRRSLSDGSSYWRRETARDHAGVVQALISPHRSTGHYGGAGGNLLDLTFVDVRLPALVYVCREKRRGVAGHRKAGAMNALLRASAVLSNAPFVLNLDCDHYVNNSLALRAAACFVLDRGAGDEVAFVQFPQRFDGVDPGDRYANHNRVFFDCTELGLDGVQGPIYVGTGCLFRRAALYGVDPPPHRTPTHIDDGDVAPPSTAAGPGKYGASVPFLNSLRAALNQRERHGVTWLLDSAAIAEATSVVSCAYEDGTEWGGDVGWTYGTVTEDVATGLSMHRRGWRSAYCATAAAPGDAFRGTAPINLTDRLQQVQRWAAGSLEIFFSRRHNALLAGRRLRPMQRVAYLNTTVYPLTSLFLLAYCLFPAISLVSGNAADGGGAAAAFLNTPPSATYIGFLAALTLTLAAIAVLETGWSGISLRDWWRNEQFWMVSATSSYLAAVAQVALKVVAGREISFKLTSKQATTGGAAGAGNGRKDKFAELYAVRWTALMVPTAVVLAVNAASMAAHMEAGRWRESPAASLAATFNVWVVLHLHPFALGLMGRRSGALSLLFLLSVVTFLTLSSVRLVLRFQS